MTIIDDYIQLRDEHIQKFGKKTTVLMQIGSFFEIYGIEKIDRHIHEVTGILNIIVSKKNKKIEKIDSSNPLMAGFPISMLEKYLDLLINDGYTVVIIEQITEAPHPERQITKIWSPSTYQTMISANEQTNNICFCYIDNAAARTRDSFVCGLAFLDCSTGSTYVDEFVSNSMDILQRIINANIRFNPTEVIVTHQDDSCSEVARDIGKLFESNSKKNHCYIIQRVDCKMSRLKYIFEDFYKNKTQMGIFEYLSIEEMPYASICLANLLDFTSKHKLSFTHSVGIPSKINDESSLDVSYNAFDQLNITSSDVCLLSVLNKSVTSIGKRYFRKRLLNPSTDSDFISRSYKNIRRFQGLNNEFIRAELSNVKDIEKVYFKKACSPREVLCIYNSLYSLKTILEHDPLRDEGLKLKWDVLEYINCTFNCTSSTEWFHSNTKLSSDDERVFKTTNPTIDSLSASISSLKKKFSDFALLMNPEHCKVDDNDRDGFFITCTTKRLQLYSKEIAGCKVSETRSGHSKVFIPNEREYNNKIVELTKLIQLELQNMFDQSIQIMLGLLTKDNVIRKYIDLIEYYDFYSTSISNNIRYRLNEPTVVECQSSQSSFLDAKQLRHVLVEHVSDDVHYVPNDISLNEHGILLYGVNASGKSCFMKSVAIAVIMAQAGMFVPATEFSYRPFKRVLTRITGNDNLFRRQSTFVLEMTELREILNKADSRSLIIGDELCSGTETVSGISIVASAIKCLSDKRCCFLFASHLHEIKELIHDTRTKVYHLSVTQGENDMLIYERIIREGSGNTLYGLEVCKSLDLNEDFLENAYRIRQSVLNIQKTGMKSSRYNSNFHFRNVCEVCQNRSEYIDIHHIVEQKDSDQFGNIENIHKNDLHNLVALCKKCHQEVHAKTIDIDGYFMTSNGRKLLTKSLKEYTLKHLSS